MRQSSAALLNTGSSFTTTSFFLEVPPCLTASTSACSQTFKRRSTSVWASTIKFPEQTPLSIAMFSRTWCRDTLSGLEAQSLVPTRTSLKSATLAKSTRSMDPLFAATTLYSLRSSDHFYI